jgi:hypothetical protein
MRRKLFDRAQQRAATLWTLIAPPTVWALHFLLCYVYAAVRCAKAGPLQPLDDVRVVVAIATLVALGLVAATGYIAWAQARLEGGTPPHDESTREDRHRFLGAAKLLLAGLSFVAIVYTAIPAFMFPDCR